MSVKIFYCKIGLILCCGLFMTACKPKPKEPEFKAPLDQFGVPYSVGDLGGNPVNLGREAEYLEYDDDPGFVSGRKYKPQVRTYQSKIQSFGFNVRYTDGLVYISYYKAPQALRKEFETQQKRPDNQWVDVGVYAGRHYFGNLNDKLNQFTLEHTNSSKDFLESVSYIYIHIPTSEYKYGLQHYSPHPKWVADYGHKDTNDLYIEKDQTGKVLTYIKCPNTEVPIAQTCTQDFILEPKMKVRASATFQKVHLQDWKLIQQQVKKVIFSFVVKPKNKAGES